MKPACWLYHCSRIPEESVLLKRHVSHISFWGRRGQLKYSKTTAPGFVCYSLGISRVSFLSPTVYMDSCKVSVSPSQLGARYVEPASGLSCSCPIKV